MNLFLAKNIIRRSAASLALCLFAGSLQAAGPYYLSYTGGPLTPQDGSDWDHALPVASLNSTLAAMTNGETLYLAGGNYGGARMTINNTASPSSRKYIVGVDRNDGNGYPELMPTSPNSLPAITIGTGVGYWTFRNLKLGRHAFGVETVGAAHPDLVFENVSFYHGEKGFVFRDCDGLLMLNCKSEKFKNSGFHVVGGSANVTFRACLADGNPLLESSWMTQSEPCGFNLQLPGEDGANSAANTNVVFEDCIAQNNFGNPADQYVQGDGWMVQRNNQGVTLRRCISRGAGDSAFDMKGDGQVFEDCVGLGGRQGFKIWYHGELTNCFSAFSWWAAVQVAGATGQVTAEHCTFHTDSPRGVRSEGASVDLRNCLITFAGAAGTYASRATGAIINLNTGTANDTKTHANAAQTTSLPRYNNPVATWNGVGNNFDNQEYGTSKGYNSSPYGDVVSLNMADATSTLAATEVVGVVPVGNWVNSTLNAQNIPDAVNSGGQATTIDFTSTGTNYGYLNSTAIQQTPLDDDSKMMRSMRGGSSSTTTTVTASQVGYAAYDIYVYWGGRTTGEPIPATLPVELQANINGTWTTTHTYYIRDENRAWDGNYTRSTATTAAAAAAGGDGTDYVVFENVTGASFRIRTVGGNRTGICGLQIVEK